MGELALNKTKVWKISIISILFVSVIAQFSILADRYKITLFFLDDSGENILVSEERNVDMPDDIIERMKVVLRNLVAGSKRNSISVIPQDTEIKEIFLDIPNRIVYIDFSDDLRKNHISGTTAEILTIRAIFKTLQANFPRSIKKVQILIDGREIDTLAGHIALSQPLPIDIFETKN